MVCRYNTISVLVYRECTEVACELINFLNSKQDDVIFFRKSKKYFYGFVYEKDECIN